MSEVWTTRLSKYRLANDVRQYSSSFCHDNLAHKHTLDVLLRILVIEMMDGMVHRFVDFEHVDIEQ